MCGLFENKGVARTGEEVGEICCGEWNNNLSGKRRNTFVRHGKRCKMSIGDADVKRPWASVRALVDEGNRVAFGPLETYIKLMTTGQSITTCRRNAVFILQLETRSDPNEKWIWVSGGTREGGWSSSQRTDPNERWNRRGRVRKEDRRSGGEEMGMLAKVTCN